VQVAPSRPRTMSRSTVVAMDSFLIVAGATRNAPSGISARRGHFDGSSWARADRRTFILLDDENGFLIVNDLSPLPLRAVKLRNAAAEFVFEGKRRLGAVEPVMVRPDETLELGRTIAGWLLDSHAHHGVGKRVVALVSRDPSRVWREHAAQAIGADPPVI